MAVLDRISEEEHTIILEVIIDVAKKKEANSDPLRATDGSKNQLLLLPQLVSDAERKYSTSIDDDDEAITKFKRPSYIRQYLILKPIRKAIQFYCDSKTEYTYDAIIYFGK